ncbi:MAG: hypothetical protein ABR977_13505, partial [Candidatus Dormibacteria bacterium]
MPTRRPPNAPADAVPDPDLAAASSPTTPADELWRFATHTDIAVRSRVAANPGSPPPLLAQLAGDRSARVRAQVAANPATPAEILEALQKDRSQQVQRRLAANPRAAELSPTGEGVAPPAAVKRVAEPLAPEAGGAPAIPGTPTEASSGATEVDAGAAAPP